MQRKQIAALLMATLPMSVVAGEPLEPRRLRVAPPLEKGPFGEALDKPVIYVDSSERLRQALVSATTPAQAVIVLDAETVFDGPFILPIRPADETGWVVLRSSAADRLPPFGRRARPSHRVHMPTLSADRGPVLEAAAGAHHYYLIGLEIRPSPGHALHNLVELGAQHMRPAMLPHHIVIDRCYLHGDDVVGSRRGVALEGRALAVIGSHLSDFKTPSSDSQALAGWSGPGPFLIRNNTLQAAGENIMFGGADPPDPSRIPSDIEVSNNHLCKPLAWRDGAEAGRWSVKNLFELKNARRVWVKGNVLEHNWVGAQNGFAVLFTVRNQEGTAPWSVVEDVAFVGNVVRHSASGINILGRDDTRDDDGRTRRVLIRDNLFDDIGAPEWGGSGALLQILNGTEDVVFENNTAVNRGQIIVAEGREHRGFVFRLNVVHHNEYGIIGTDTGPGLHTIEVYFPEALIAGNVIIGGATERYPAGNLFPPSIAAAAFASDGYALEADSPFRQSPGGNRVGADIDALASLLLLPEEGCQ